MFNTAKTNNTNVTISASIETNKKNPFCPLPPTTAGAAPHSITASKSQSYIFFKDE